MGSFADNFAAYIEPLMDETHGSMEEVDRALMLGQICWNCAISPDNLREKMLNGMERTLDLSHEEFEAFKTEFIVPMIARHYAMFPHMHTADTPQVPQQPPARQSDTPASAGNKTHPTPPNAPCPCNSGKKYKRCCGRMD